jgi:hypothetical protein
LALLSTQRKLPLQVDYIGIEDSTDGWWDWDSLSSRFISLFFVVVMGLGRATVCFSRGVLACVSGWRSGGEDGGFGSEFLFGLLKKYKKGSGHCMLLFYWTWKAQWCPAEACERLSVVDTKSFPFKLEHGTKAPCFWGPY